MHRIVAFSPYLYESAKTRADGRGLGFSRYIQFAIQRDPDAELHWQDFRDGKGLRAFEQQHHIIKKENVKISIYLPDDLYEEVRFRLKNREWTLARYIRHIISYELLDQLLSAPPAKTVDFSVQTGMGVY